MSQQKATTRLSAEAARKGVTVAVVGGDAESRLYFREMLESAEGFGCVGDFARATDALKSISALQPDCVLMSVRLPDGNGWECIARLKDVLPHLRVVLVGGRGEAEGMESARDAGADAWLVQPVHVEQCLATLRWVTVQRAEPGRSTGGACSSVRPVEGALPIRPRQQAILQGLAAGLLYKEIAQRLGLSYSAVHKHQHQIFRKLRVNNRSEAIALWLKQVLRRQGD